MSTLQCTRSMWWLLFDSATPSYYVTAKFKKGLPHLISRGAKIEKITDTHILIQDIDEWLWKDAQTLDRICKYQLINHVYSSVSTSTDGLNGIVVSISIVQNSRMWTLLQGMILVAICVFFSMWTHYVYASGVLVTS